MGQILIPPKINKKNRPMQYMSGKPDWNYCIQYRKEGGDKSEIIRFCGTDEQSTHRTILAIVREEMNHVTIEDMWMEPLGSWDKPGRYQFHNMSLENV